MKYLIAILLLPTICFSQEYDLKVKKYLDENNIEKAEKRINKLFSSDTNNLDYLYLKSVVNRKRGRYVESLVNLKQIISRDTNYAFAYDEIGIIQVIYFQNSDAAMSYLEKAQSLKVNDPLILSHIGSIYQIQENYPLAIEYYKKALEMQPENDYLHYNLGITYFETSKYNLALNEFDKGLEIRKKDSKTLYDRGRVKFELKMYKEALVDFKKCLKYRSTENKYETISKKSIIDYIIFCKDRIN